MSFGGIVHRAPRDATLGKPFFIVMKRILTFAGGSAGSYLGWILGSPGGFFLAFVLSTVGFGVGYYLAWRFAREYLL